MESYTLLVATQEKTLYEGTVVSAIFPGADGQFEILANHAPFVAKLKKGPIQIKDAHEQKTTLNIEEGFFEVYKNKATVLTKAQH